MILVVTNDGHADAEPSGDGAFRHGVRGVVSSFGVDIGAEFFKKGFHVGFGKEHDEIHAAKRGDEMGTRVFIEDGTAGALQLADAGIRIHADNKDVAFAARAFEITNMSDVQGVKASVGENDPPTATLVVREFLAQHISRDNFGSGFTHDLRSGSGCLVTDGVEKLFAQNGGSATFHDHQAAGDVGDVRGFEG